MKNSYVMVLARSVDILCCTFIWRDYDITISSMCGLELRKGAAAKWWAKLLGGFLNGIQPGHCELAIIADQTRATVALLMLGGGR